MFTPFKVYNTSGKNMCFLQNYSYEKINHINGIVCSVWHQQLKLVTIILNWRQRLKIVTGALLVIMLISAIYSPKTRDAFVFPHVIPSLTAVRGIYEWLSPWRQYPGNLNVMSWLFPKHLSIGNDVWTLLIIQGIFDFPIEGTFV